MPTARPRRIAFACAALAALAALAAELPAQQAPLPTDCVRRAIGPVVVNVASVLIRPRFLLNGRPFPGAAAGTAVITLWASDPSPLFDGPQLSLGETHQPPRAVRVVPGVYDVYYSRLSGSLIPRNEMTRVMQRVPVLQDGELLIDVPMVRIAGFKRHNGKPFADDRSSAKLSLQRADGRGEVPLGGIRPSPFAVRVIAGPYSFRYDWQWGTTVPRNRRTTVGAPHALESDRQGLVLDVPSVAQDFSFLHNGAPFPSSEFERGDVVLTGRGGAEVALGSTHQPPPTIRIVPGRYDARFRHVAGAHVPRNLDGLVEPGLVVSGSPSVIDIPSVEVAGAILLNGAAPPASEFDNARLNLVAGGSDRLRLGETRYGAYQVRVIPGRYDVEYEHVVGAALPANPRAVLWRGWDVARVASRTLDIPAARFHGPIWLNGEPFPGSDFQTGDIWAVPLAPDRSPLLLGRAHYGAYDKLVLPGSYQPAYAHVVGAGGIPRNTFTTFGAPARVARGDEVEKPPLDIFADELHVSYQHNGVPMPLGGPAVYRAHLQRGLNYLRLRESSDGPFGWTVMEGTFDLFYQYRGGSGLPKNAFMRFGCWDLVRSGASGANRR
jgi:hypothetical protein